jgi:uncharacterized protein
MRRLPSISYLKFPFTIDTDGAAASTRQAHVREQIEQVLFTNPGERIFRPEFGAGVQHLLFEPNAQPLRELARKRLSASLSEALQGEVDPRTLEIEPEFIDETLYIRITYQLAALGEREEHVFELTTVGLING